MPYYARVIPTGAGFDAVVDAHWADAIHVSRLTSAQIAALTAPEKPAGVYFHNTTTGKMMVSDGSSVVEPYGMWTAWTCTVTGSITNPTGTTQVGSAWTRVGNLATVRGAVTVPLATKGSGAYYFSLPVNMAVTPTDPDPVAVAGTRDDAESALANLLTALADAGVIADQTSATA